MTSRGYDPRIHAMHIRQAFNEYLAEQRYRAQNPDFVARESRIEELQKQLMLWMGEAEFRAWGREAIRGINPDNFTESYLAILEKKVSELQPDSLFSEVILLEHRQQELLKAYRDSANQAELAGELAEISTALERDYGHLGDVSEARRGSRFGRLP